MLLNSIKGIAGGSATGAIIGGTAASFFTPAMPVALLAATGATIFASLGGTAGLVKDIRQDAQAAQPVANVPVISLPQGAAKQTAPGQEKSLSQDTLAALANVSLPGVTESPGESQSATYVPVAQPNNKTNGIG